MTERPVSGGAARASGPHWLTATLQRAGVAAAGDLTLPPGPLPRAWAAARDALGIADAEIARHVASRFHLRLAEIEGASATASKLVPASLARKHHVVPLREDDREIVVATADPTDLEAEQALGFASGRQVAFEIAPPTSIEAALAKLYPPHGDVDALMERVDATRADAVRIVHDELAGAVTRADTGESSAVIRLTNLILRNAIDHRADVLEIGPDDEGAAVSLAIDGVWSRLLPLPVPAMQRVTARLRLLGNLGTGNRTWTREGVARITVEGRTYDLLIDTVARGSRQATRVRILDQQFTPRVGDLGFDASSAAALAALARSAGLVLLAGPPHAGLATLQYALLREAAHAGRGVALADEGLRWELHGVLFAPVADATRAARVRELARRGVDVIGLDVADDADVLAAIVDSLAPGRLVLARTTVADATELRARLGALRAATRDASVEPMIVVARRLRRTCALCRGAGCEACARTGFRGVVPIVAIIEPGAAAEDALGLLERAARERIRAGDSTEAELHRVLGGAPAEPTPRPTRVLVADDDPLIRLLARTVLEADGMEALEAEDGEEAVQRIDAERDVDLVILDLDMPRLDGHGVLARLKRDVRTAGLPVIVLTASTNPQDETRVLERGAADYVRKPIDPPRFQARVRAALRRIRG